MGLCSCPGGWAGSRILDRCLGRVAQCDLPNPGRVADDPNGGHRPPPGNLVWLWHLAQDHRRGPCLLFPHCGQYSRWSAVCRPRADGPATYHGGQQAGPFCKGAPAWSDAYDLCGPQDRYHLQRGGGHSRRVGRGQPWSGHFYDPSDPFLSHGLGLCQHCYHRRAQPCAVRGGGAAGEALSALVLYLAGRKLGRVE